MNRTESTLHSNPPQAEEGEGALVGSIVFMCVLLGLLLNSPLVRQLIPGLADPPRVQSLGPVLCSSFIGGFGFRTQIEVASGVVLLRGAVEVGHGALVERRVSALEQQLCVVGTDRCHDILSRQEGQP